MQPNANSEGYDNVVELRKSKSHEYDVFVSYCKKDERSWKEIDTYLTNLRREGVEIYDDDVIEAGERVGDEARHALETSAVAVLLLSQDYIASDLMEHELPDLLERVEHGTLMLTLHIGVFDEYNLGRITQYRRVGARFKPLNKLRKPDREEVYLELIKVIRRRLIKLQRHPG